MSFWSVSISMDVSLSMGSDLISRVTFECCPLLWITKLDFIDVANWHCSHLKTCLVSWARKMCHFLNFKEGNISWHESHGNSPWRFFVCFSSKYFSPYAESQNSHLKGFMFSWTFLVWRVSPPDPLKLLLQVLQVYLLPWSWSFSSSVSISTLEVVEFSIEAFSIVLFSALESSILELIVTVSCASLLSFGMSSNLLAKESLLRSLSNASSFWVKLLVFCSTLSSSSRTSSFAVACFAICFLCLYFIW